MSLLYLYCYNNIIYEGGCIPLIYYIAEQVIHYCLEGSKGVYEPKVYYGWLIGSNVHYECCLLFVFFFDSNIVILLP